VTAVPGDAVAALQPPWLHPDSGAVQFQVALPAGTPIGAILSKEVLRYRYQARADGADAVALYEANRQEIDAVVRPPARSSR
jgi:hypothetical protein